MVTIIKGRADEYCSADFDTLVLPTFAIFNHPILLYPFSAFPLQPLSFFPTTSTEHKPLDRPAAITTEHPDTAAVKALPSALPAH